MRNEQEIDRLFHQTLVSTITVKFSVGPGAHQVLLQKTELSVCVGSTHTKIGTLQRLAWPLPKDEMKIREVFHNIELPHSFHCARTQQETTL